MCVDVCDELSVLQRPLCLYRRMTTFTQNAGGSVLF